MTMTYDQWKRILSAINKEEGLNHGRTVKNKEKLQVENEDEYKGWEEAGFDVNYRFRMEKIPHGVVHHVGMSPLLDCRCTLLLLAALNGHTRVVNILLEAGANANVVNGGGNTALHLAAYNGYTEIVKALIVEGANVNAVNCRKDTPLHWAVLGDSTEVVDILVKAGANLNAVNARKDTPLSKAAYDDNTKMFNILVKAGTDVLLFGENGYIKQFLEKKAIKKGIFAGCSTAALGVAIAVVLFATDNITSDPSYVISAVVIVAALAFAAGGVTYGVLKPNTKIDATEEAQKRDGNVLKVA